VISSVKANVLPPQKGYSLQPEGSGKAQANKTPEIAKAQSQAQTQMDQSREDYQRDIQKAQSGFTQSIQKTYADQNSILNEITQHSQNELQNIQTTKARNIDAYAKQQDDPFYQLVQLNGQLSEDETSYFVTFKIPEYEQDHLSANICGNQIILSGHRKSEEIEEMESGHQMTSSSYQIYRESFPLAWPIEPKTLSKVCDGEQVVIRVNKKII
jgi:HSP20 family molecular chaperone IbpA